MDHMIVAHINGKMLTWARERAGFEIARLAKGKVTVNKLKAWESGKEFPSQSQAIALAEKLGISYPMLFMPTVPPPDVPPIPDLRTLVGKPITAPSLDFREVLDDTLARQDWVRQERKEEGRKPLAFVGKYTISDDPRLVAADMRRVLELKRGDREECHDFEAFIRHLVSRAEKSGILVMRSSVVRHATNRPLKVDEFRGFALSDPLAPIIFVNDSDAKAAQVFTIAHELAHIWIAADGVSDRKPNQKGESKNAIELFCDQVAAEGLVPSTEFSSTWVGKSVMENAKNAAAHFRVSTLVALRRARDLGYISFDSFMVHVDAEYTRFREIEKKKKAPSKKKDGGGGNFWASFEIRNSRAFNAAVVTAIRSNRTTFTEASNLLGVTLAATVRYLKRVSAN